MFSLLRLECLTHWTTVEFDAFRVVGLITETGVSMQKSEVVMDFDDLGICCRARHSEQLSPLHVLGGLLWLPRYSRERVRSSWNYLNERFVCPRR